MKGSHAGQNVSIGLAICHIHLINTMTLFVLGSFLYRNRFVTVQNIKASSHYIKALGFQRADK